MTRSLLGGLVLLAASAVGPALAQACSRDGLLGQTYNYINAQTAGKPSSLSLASNFTYQENNKAVDVSKGVLSTALKIDYNRSMADTTQCASYVMFISSTGSKPYVVATQIRHDGNDTSSIAIIDSIVATTGSLAFNAKQTLTYEKAENWSALAPAQQPSRTLLKTYGDAYLDMWTDATAAGKIKWGTDCERVEGSSLTRPCGASLPHGGSAKANGDRRYVIDETIGAVDVMCEFSSLGNMPDSHEIKVDDSGFVKYVHTVTVVE